MSSLFLRRHRGLSAALALLAVTCVGVVAAVPAAAAVVRADEAEDELAEVASKLARAQETAAAAIQRVVSQEVLAVMNVPNFSRLRLSNQVQRSVNRINLNADRVIAEFEALVDSERDRLFREGYSVLELDPVFAPFELEGPERLDDIAAEGIFDVRKLVSINRRTTTVRGQLAGRYTLGIEDDFGAVTRIDVRGITIGEDLRVVGAFDSQAVADALGVGEIDTQDRFAIRAVRWMFRGTELVFSSADSRISMPLAFDSVSFVVTGTDLLPCALRDAIVEGFTDEQLADIERFSGGLDSYFRSIRFRFERIVDDPSVQ